MSHLKVELRSLKRSTLPRCYAFDLTRYCSGCWTKFGRITNRGRVCPQCHRKVCKACRCWTHDTHWVCASCHDKKDPMLTLWRQKLDRAHSSSTYSQTKRHSDMTGNSVISIHPPSATYEFVVSKLTRESVNVDRKAFNHVNVLPPTPCGKMENISIATEGASCPSGFGGRADENDKSKSKGFPIRSECNFADPVQHWLLNCWKENPTLIEGQSFDDESCLSATLDSKRYPSNRIYKTSKPLERGTQKVTDPSNCRKTAPVSCMSVSATEEKSSEEKARPITHESCEPKQGTTEFPRSSALRHSFFGTFRSPELSQFSRNDPYGRLSVRDHRIPPNAYFKNNVRTAPNFSGLKPRRSKSISIPTQISDDSEYSEVLSYAFVECRVQKLEEYLNKNVEDCFSEYDDIDIQSLFSFDLDCSTQYRDDYRLVYLSSSQTSDDSIVDYGDAENLSAFCSTRLLPMAGREGTAGSVDWDFSDSSSSEEKTTTFEVDWENIPQSCSRSDRTGSEINDEIHSSNILEYNEELKLFLSGPEYPLQFTNQSLIFCDCPLYFDKVVSGQVRNTFTTYYVKTSYGQNSLTVNYKIIEAKIPLKSFCMDYSTTKAKVNNKNELQNLSGRSEKLLTHSKCLTRAERLPLTISKSDIRKPDITEVSNMNICNIREQKGVYDESKETLVCELYNAENEQSERDHNKVSTMQPWKTSSCFCPVWEQLFRTVYSTDQPVPIHDSADDDAVINAHLWKSPVSATCNDNDDDENEITGAHARHDCRKLSLSKYSLNNQPNELFPGTYCNPNSEVFLGHTQTLMRTIKVQTPIEIFHVASQGSNWNRLPSFFVLSATDKGCFFSRTHSNVTWDHVFLSRCTASPLEWIDTARRLSNLNCVVKDDKRNPYEIYSLIGKVEPCSLFTLQVQDGRDCIKLNLTQPPNVLDTVRRKNKNCFFCDCETVAASNVSFICHCILHLLQNQNMDVKNIATAEGLRLIVTVKTSDFPEVTADKFLLYPFEITSKEIKSDGNTKTLEFHCLTTQNEQKQSVGPIKNPRKKGTFEFTSLTAQKTSQSKKSLARNAQTAKLTYQSLHNKLMGKEFVLQTANDKKLSAKGFLYVNDCKLLSHSDVKTLYNAAESGEIAGPISLRRGNSQDEVSFASPGKQTEVIDTRCSATSKTGRAAFTEFRGRRTAVAAATVSLPRCCTIDCIVTAVRRGAAVQEYSSLLAENFSPYVCDEKPEDVSEREKSHSVVVKLREHPNLCDRLHLCCSTTVPTACVGLRQDSEWSVSFVDNVLSTNGDGPNMYHRRDGITPRGSKIAELKKFFDSAHTTSDSSVLVKRSDNPRGVSKAETSCAHSVPGDLNENEGDNSVISDKCEIASPFSTAHIGNNSSRSVVGVNDFPKDTIKNKESVPVVSDEDSVENVGKLNHLNSHCLWSGVDTGSKGSSSESRGYCVNGENVDSNQSYSSTDTLTSTLELNNLIAVTRAELLKNEVAATVPEKSMLENYFTYAFENSNLQQTNRITHDENCSSPSSKMFLDGDDIGDENSQYECDMDEMYFEDLDDGTISDTSSDDDIRCRSSPPNNPHLQTFSLHTIIEESCEESERESQTATPTNQDPTSKLEKYFSWDIVNDANHDLKQRDSCDESTLYSDSLSEASSSLNGEEHCMEPSPLSSSRLEKYFMSGLVGNENYHYPEDAEFLDDTSVSDFDEEDRHHKISRSALLNSLDLRSASISQCFEARNPNLSMRPFSEIESNEIRETEVEFEDGICDSHSESRNFGDHTVVVEDTKDGPNSYKSDGDQAVISNGETDLTSSEVQEVIFLDDYSLNKTNIQDVKEAHTTDLETSMATSASCAMEKEQSSEESCITNIPLNPIEDGEQQIIGQSTEDPKVILSKIMSQISETSTVNESEPETDYISAWQLLESEIEQLMNHAPSNSHAENGSRTSSTFGSSNSDYGSDTIDSGECLTTDEDDNCVESKNKSEISHVSKAAAAEENMEVCRKIVESFKKGEFAQYLKLTGGELDQVQSYVRDCIISFMKNANPDKKVRLLEECNSSDGKNILLLLENNESKDCITEQDKCVNAESFCNFKSDLTTIDEGISVDSTDNLYSDCDVRPSTFSIEETHFESKTTKEPNTVSGDSPVIPEFPSMNKDSSVAPTREETESTFDKVVAESVYVVNGDSSSEVSYSEHNSESSAVMKTSNDENHCGTTADVPGVVHPSNKDATLKSLNGSQSSLDDSTSQFSVYVDIQIGDEATSVKERKQTSAVTQENLPQHAVKRTSLHLWISQEAAEIPPDSDKSSATEDIVDVQSLKSSHSVYESHDTVNDISSDVSNFISTYPKVSHRDTGYYSFKSSEDSMLYGAESENEIVESTVHSNSDFESLEPNSRRCSIKSSASATVLSQSTTNIPQALDADLKFSTLQPKSRTLKVSMNPRSAAPDSRSPTSIFSPGAVLKKFKSSKGSSSETTYPAKYLKKYGRSSSVDSDNIYGATSMPHLGFAADSYSVNGGIDCDRESSVTDDELDGKYSTYNQSILSLGAHSASTTSVYSAAGGRHFGYISISGDVLFGLNYNQKSQMMEVFVKQCRNLAAMDSRKNKSDPYVKVYLLPDKSKSGKRKTKTKKNTLNPVFNELLRFPVLKHELESRTLWLSVWNSDLFGRNDFLGEVTLNLGYRLLDSPTLRWYPLQERSESLTSPLTYKGELFLALKYVPKDLSLESRFRPAPVISLKGALHVLIKEARNITLGKNSGTFDSFCKSYLLPDKSKSSKQKTPVLKKSRHPKWYYTMIYENLSVEELKDRSLELTLWDHDKLTSNEFMGGVRINGGTGLYHGVSVEWMDSTRDEACLWQSMLERPNMWVDGCLSLRPTMQSLRS